jgi:putative ABC transport system substrate-binding protein
MKSVIAWVLPVAALMAASIAPVPVPAAEPATKHIGVTTMNDTPQLLEVRDGMLKRLAQLGYVQGKNLAVEYKSAQADFANAQQIARQFAGESLDVIVPITTPSAQAVVAATKTTPIVFSTVTDPVKAGVVPRLQHPGGNVTGVTDWVPINKQIAVIREIVPKLKRLGFVYDPGLDNSRVFLDVLKGESKKLGFTLVPAAAVSSNDVSSAGRSLVGKVDAIYVPNDTTVYAGLEALIKVGEDTKIPIFTAERRGVQRGAVACIGYNFGEMGAITADLVDKVLKGTSPGTIDVVPMSDAGHLSLFVNKTSATKMGVKLPDDLVKRADKVF